MNPVQDLHSDTWFRQAMLALQSSHLAAQQSQTASIPEAVEGLAQGHFCTNGGCSALLENHQAWLKRKLCSTCLIFKAGPALNQRLGQRPLEGSEPICCCSRLSHGQACQQQLAGNCRYPCTFPDSCWDVSQQAKESNTNKNVAGWCQDLHMSFSKCQKSGSAHHNQFVEEPYGPARLCGAMYRIRHLPCSEQSGKP